MTWAARAARMAALAAAAAGLLAACGGGSAISEDRGAPAADRFDAAAAYRLLADQVRVGQRPAGSPQLRRLARRLRRMLPAGELEPIPGEPGLRNVVGTLPGSTPGIVVGAHYDTLVRPKGFVGANNGAAGTAIVVWAARALAGVGPVSGREIRFVLFDGEEPAAGLPEEVGDFYGEGLRGSRAYVAANPGRTSRMVLLDYVGNEGLRLPREATSDAELWERLRLAANAVGASSYFPDATGPPILDDHTPFLRAGVPAVDLIDWDYPGHDRRDSLDRISVASLDAVGETVVRLVGELRRE